MFTYFTFLFGRVLFYISFLCDAIPVNGWFAYLPLSDTTCSPDNGMDFCLPG